MATFTIDLTFPSTHVDELVEMLRGIGGIESIQFSIEAETRREATRETIDMLEEYSATYRGMPLDREARDDIEDNFKRTSPRISYPI